MRLVFLFLLYREKTMTYRGDVGLGGATQMDTGAAGLGLAAIFPNQVRMPLTLARARGGFLRPGTLSNG